MSLREELDKILGRNIRVKDTVYGEKEYYFLSEAGTQVRTRFQQAVEGIKNPEQHSISVNGVWFTNDKWTAIEQFRQAVRELVKEEE